MTVTERIRQHLLQETLGMRERLPGPDVLGKTEWSLKFESLMRCRLIMGAFRYGRLSGHGDKNFDRTGRIQREISEYLKDRNKERLVDIANMCLLEFEFGAGEYVPVDDGYHTPCPLPSPVSGSGDLPPAGSGAGRGAHPIVERLLDALGIRVGSVDYEDEL